jgi:DNA modification methylase
MTPWLADPDVTLYHGDNLDVLRTLPDKSVHMCATSPPFYGLRDYGTGEWEGGQPDCDHLHKVGGTGASTLGAASGGNDMSDEARERSTTRSYVAYAGTCGKCGARRVDKQIGLEETPDQWVQNLVAVFREVRRVLRDDGTLWVEIGDSYVSGQGGRQSSVGEMPAAPLALNSDGDVGRADVDTGSWRSGATSKVTPARGTTDLKPKDLLGQPWLLAFALRNDGWYLRSEIIWARPNPMPESVTDRPTKSHSTVFLLSKQPRYFYDADAIRETSVSTGYEDKVLTSATPGYSGNPRVVGDKGKPLPGVWQNGGGANARSVWTVPTQPTPFAHFATWPEALCRRMILAGTSERGCCPECGAPWVRDVEPEGAYAEALAKPTWASGGLERGAGANKTVSVTRTTRTTRTTGWSPGCAHDAAPVPCTVLDPFAGSATTMLVARNHGRHSIGIELNETYLEIAAKRLQQLSLLA